MEVRIPTLIKPTVGKEKNTTTTSTITTTTLDLHNYRDLDQTPSPGFSPSPSLSPSPNPRNQMISYKECQKNHAAHLGSHVVDGCGEFMPGGEVGSSEALLCAACDCHRNFHRREVEGETSAATPPPPILQLPAPHHHRTTTTPNTVNNNTPVSNCYISFNKPEKIAPVVRPNPNSTPYTNNSSQRMSVMMAFGGSGTAAESSSEDLNAYRNVEMSGQLMQQYGASKKRFRTKFTQEQKDKMMECAERIGWRIQKQDEVQVHQLCNEVGIKRQVFKVWMHNNKQAMKRKQP